MKKRILFLRRTCGFGGVEKCILDLLAGVDYERSDVWLASLTDVFSRRIATRRLPVTLIPLPVPVTGGLRRFFFAWVAFLRRVRPDQIIMVEGGFFDFPWLAVLAAYLVSGGRVYMTEHLAAFAPPPKVSRIHFGFLPGLGLWWYKQVWPRRIRGYLAKRILAVSKGVREKLITYYGYPREKIHVAYRWADTSRFAPASEEKRRSLRATLGIPDDAVVVVSTARLDPIKCLDRLIRAFGVLSPAHPNLWMLIAGEGPLRDELEGLAKSVDPNQRIRFLGHLEDVSPVIQASDIYVLPSDEEGFATALVEAMSAKLTCVATRATGPTEIIEDGENGFLVERSYEGVLNGLEKALLLREDQKRAMGECARATVEEHFQMWNGVQRMLTLLDIEFVQAPPLEVSASSDLQLSTGEQGRRPYSWRPSSIRS